MSSNFSRYMIFPQYPGAEERLQEIYHAFGHKKELKLVETDFLAETFDLTCSEGYKCLVDYNWIVDTLEEDKWYKHPEIVAIGYRLGYNDLDTYYVFHPNWGYLRIQEDDLLKNGEVFCGKLTPEIFGLNLMQGEQAFSLVGDFEFLEDFEISDLTIKKDIDNQKVATQVQNTLNFILNNSRDLDLKDISIILYMLRHVHHMLKLLYINVANINNISDFVWDSIKQIIDYMPHIGYSLLKQKTNHLTVKNKWVYSPSALAYCMEDLDFLIQTYKNFHKKVAIKNL